jgi:nitroimidazol reductase NimA-like FMN-containing flavoprotein (pyridoxamine 5'-phosphate oxidase superfamily)
MEPTTEDRELVELDPSECATLLEVESVGRVAVAHEGEGPDVVPVNYVVRDGHPIFRSHDGVLLSRLLGAQVSLQVDRFDWFHRIGWSVLARGVAELVAPDEAERMRSESDAAPAPDPWVPGDQPHLVRVRVERITGRRIELHQDALDGRGYL